MDNAMGLPRYLDDKYTSSPFAPRTPIRIDASDLRGHVVHSYLKGLWRQAYRKSLPETPHALEPVAALLYIGDIGRGQNREVTVPRFFLATLGEINAVRESKALMKRLANLRRWSCSNVGGEPAALGPAAISVAPDSAAQLVYPGPIEAKHCSSVWSHPLDKVCERQT